MTNKSDLITCGVHAHCGLQLQPPMSLGSPCDFPYGSLLKCALCGDANLRRLERQSCSGRHHAMDQALYEVSRKHHSRFHLTARYVMGEGEYFTGIIFCDNPRHSGIDIIFDPQELTAVAHVHNV